MSVSVLYVINAVCGFLGGFVGKSRSTLSGAMTFLQLLVLIGTGIYAGIVYSVKNVLIILAISIGTAIIFAIIKGFITGYTRKKSEKF